MSLFRSPRDPQPDSPRPATLRPAMRPVATQPQPDPPLLTCPEHGCRRQLADPAAAVDHARMHAHAWRDEARIAEAARRAQAVEVARLTAVVETLARELRAAVRA